jgi:hypothetical protein
MDEDKLLEKLILSGAVSIAGIDSETGEFLYQFTPILKDVHPQLYHEYMNHVNEEIMGLWERGFLNIDFMEDNPRVTLTQKAFDQNELSSLSKEDKWAIEEIKRSIASK